MFCSNCGNKVEDNAVFCPHCGNKIMRNDNSVISNSSNQGQAGGRGSNSLNDKKYLYGLIVSLVLAIIFGVLSFKAVTPNMVKCTIISVSDGRVTYAQFEDGSESEYTTQDLHVKYKNHEGHLQITSRDFKYYEGDSIKLCLTKGELTQKETKSIDGFMEIAIIILFVLSIISCGWFGFKYSRNMVSIIISIVVAVIAILAIILVFTLKGGSLGNKDEATEEPQSEPAVTEELATEEPQSEPAVTEELATEEPAVTEEPAIYDGAIAETYEASPAEAVLDDWKQVYLKAIDDGTIWLNDYCSYDLIEITGDNIPELLVYEGRNTFIYTVYDNELLNLIYACGMAKVSGNLVLFDGIYEIGIYNFGPNGTAELFYAERNEDNHTYNYNYNDDTLDYEEVLNMACDVLGVDRDFLAYEEYPYNKDSILTAISEY